MVEATPLSNGDFKIKVSSKDSNDLFFTHKILKHKSPVIKKNAKLEALNNKRREITDYVVNSAKEKIDKLNQADTLIFQTEKQLKEFGDKVPADKKEPIEKALAELKTASPGQIKIEYLALPEGAQINYSTKLPKFISAIHQWFDAQLSDHARHAVPEYSHQYMH